MPGKNFEKQFEFHKIPEYYEAYFKYSKLKELILDFQKRAQSKRFFANDFRIQLGQDSLSCDCSNAHGTAGKEFQRRLIVHPPPSKTDLYNDLLAHA